MSASSDVYVGQDGTVHIAPYGTALPTAFSEALDAAFEPLGLVSENGLSVDYSVSSTLLRAWDGSAVRNLTTTTDITFSLNFLETAAEKLQEVFWGNDVTSGTGDSSITLDRPADKYFAMVFATVDSSTGDAQRFCLPRVQVTTRGPLAFNGSTAGVDLSFAALDDTTFGSSGVLQFNRDITAAPGGLVVAKAKVKAEK